MHSPSIRHRGGVSEQQRVVVGVDGSESSRVGLRWALAEAQLRDATLEVLHAWRTPMIFVPLAYSQELVEMGKMHDAALAFIDEQLDAVGADADCGVVIEPAAVEGYAAHALIEASHRAQLVVVGRHGQGGFPHELIGPKAVQVAHHSACPVTVVPDEWTGDGRGVVVGVDGSEPSAAALVWAVAEAARRHAPLTAVMAWGLLDQHHPPGAEPFDPHYSEADALATLDEFVASAVGAESPVLSTVVNDLPARALIDLSGAAELLVVGARGLGGFRDLLLGSVSHRCLAQSRCPTVVVR